MYYEYLWMSKYIRIWWSCGIMTLQFFSITKATYAIICQFYFHGPCFAGSTWPQLSGARFQHRTWPSRLMFDGWIPFVLTKLNVIRRGFSVPATPYRSPTTRWQFDWECDAQVEFRVLLCLTPASQTSEVSTLYCQRLLQTLAKTLQSHVVKCTTIQLHCVKESGIRNAGMPSFPSIF